MILFRLLLAAFLATIIVYTLITGTNHGWNLLPVFFGDMMAMTWPGQFNLDFMTFLILSSVWVMWRNAFTPAAIVLGIVALFGGMLFLSIYLLVLSYRCDGDIRKLMLGGHSTNVR